MPLQAWMVGCVYIKQGIHLESVEWCLLVATKSQERMSFADAMPPLALCSWSLGARASLETWENSSVSKHMCAFVVAPKIHGLHQASASEICAIFWRRYSYSTNHAIILRKGKYRSLWMYKATCGCFRDGVLKSWRASWRCTTSGLPSHGLRTHPWWHQQHQKNKRCVSQVVGLLMRWIPKKESAKLLLSTTQLWAKGLSNA